MMRDPTRPLRKTFNAEAGRGAPGASQAHSRDEGPMRKLPKWEGRKLHSVMPLLFRRRSLLAAWEDVKRNKGAPGVDGVTVEDYAKDAKARLKELSEALRTHAWHPRPLRSVPIPKAGGGTRELRVACVEDRVVAAAVARILYAVFEDEFGPDCYAYVEGRSALDAVQRVQAEARKGRAWVLETDITKFFDTIPRERLLDKLATRIADGSFLRLVRALVSAQVAGKVQADAEALGIPQGSPLSPVLANIYLARFDRHVARRYAMCRYADDLVLLCASKAEGEQAQMGVEELLRQEGLSLKPQKTRIARLSSGIDFLGYRITTRGVGPSAAAVKRYKERVRGLTVRHDKRPLQDAMDRVMPVVRGWSNYFRLSRRDELVWDLGDWTLQRLKAYDVGHRWYGAWRRHVPTERLYGMGLKLPYHFLTGPRSLRSGKPSARKPHARFGVADGGA